MSVQGQLITLVGGGSKESGIKQPDATLEELCEAVAEATNQPRVAAAAMCVELQSIEAAAQKKTLHPAERESERVQQRRAEFETEVKVEVL